MISNMVANLFSPKKPDLVPKKPEEVKYQFQGIFANIKHV